MDQPTTHRVTEEQNHTELSLQVGDLLVLEDSEAYDAPGASIFPMGGEPGPVTHPLRPQPGEAGGFVAVSPGRARLSVGERFDIEVVVRPKPGRARPLGARR